MAEFKFSIPLKVSCEEINDANHVDFQVYLSYFQRAQIAYLHQFGFSLLDIHGYGLIVSEVHCTYKQELYSEDDISVKCRVSELKSKSFIMDYQILKTDMLCAFGFMHNMCFDYRKKIAVRLPQEFVRAIKEFEGIVERKKTAP